MLHFEGERDFPMAAEELFTKLSDASFLVRCIPEATIEGEPTREQGKCSVRPNLGFVRGNMDVTLRIMEAVAPTAVKFQLLSKGVGSTSEVETNLTIAPTAKGSHVVWKADVTSLGGLLKVVPSGLIRGAAQKTIEDVWNGIAVRLEGSAGS